MEKSTNPRDLLFDPEIGATDETLRLHNATDRLNQSSKTLEQTRKLALETEDIAVGVVTDLRSQREVINRTRGRVEEVDGNLSQARHLIVNMGRRAMQSKMLLTGVAALLAVAILNMSLRLDQLEADISRLLARPIVLFSYPSCVSKLSAQITVLRRKLTTGSYGPKTREKVDLILNTWSSIKTFPSENFSHLEVILWTLDCCKISRSNVKYVFLGSNFLLIFLTQYELRINLTTCDKLNLPLRFYLACICPFVTSTPPPQLSSLPVEVLWQTVEFFPMEEMSLLTGLNRFWDQVVSSDQVWKPIYEHQGGHSEMNRYKEKVREIVLRKERRQMLRFANSTLEWEPQFDYEIF